MKSYHFSKKEFGDVVSIIPKFMRKVLIPKFVVSFHD